MNFFKRNTGNIRSFVFTLCLLFHTFWHGRCGVTKSFIFCKLCLICRNQFFPIFDIVNIINSKTTSFLEEWTKNFSVNSFSCIFLIIYLQKFCFQRIMPRRVESLRLIKMYSLPVSFATSSTTSAIALCASVVCSVVNPLELVSM